jgi:hypothetical protein
MPKKIFGQARASAQVKKLKKLQMLQEHGRDPVVTL